MATITLVTSEQYLSMPAECDAIGNRVKDELIGGEIVRKAFATQLHDLAKMNIVRALARHADNNQQLALTVFADTAFALSEYDIFAPDVSIVAKSRLNAIKVFPAPKSVELHSPGAIREFKGGRNVEDSLLPGYSEPVASFFETN